MRPPHRIAVLLALSLSGCALFRSPAIAPTADTAVVRGTAWGKIYRSGFVQIVSLGAVTPGWRSRSDLAIAPGEQVGVFDVYLCTGAKEHCVSLAEAEVKFRAEVGHLYLARAQEKLHGSNQFWVWIEDAQSRSVVGGTEPVTRG